MTRKQRGSPSTAIARLIDRVLPADVSVQLGRSATGSVALRIWSTLLALGISIVLARVLGPEGYGVYSFAFSLILLLALPAQAGMPTLLVREIARYDVTEDWGLIRGLLKRSNQAVGVLTLLISLGAVTFIVASGWDGVGPTSVYFWALALLPLMALGNLRGAALRGLRLVVQGQLPEYLLRPGLYLLLICAFILTGIGEPTATTAMALHVGAALFAYVIGVWLLRRGLPRDISRSTPAFRTRSWFKTLFPLTLLAGIEMINNQMDVVLLGLMASARDVGLYRVAWQASMPVLFTLTAVNLVVGPHFARAHHAADRERLQRLATWSARVALMLALPAATIFIVFGGPILGFVFGREFGAGGTALALLCVGQLCNVGVGSVGTLLNMTGNERETVVGVAIAAVVNFALNVILIPRFGITGAAFATMSSMIIWNLILFTRAKQRTGIVTWALHRTRQP